MSGYTFCISHLMHDDECLANEFVVQVQNEIDSGIGEASKK
jgi:hypothetical protein